MVNPAERSGKPQSPYLGYLGSHRLVAGLGPIYWTKMAGIMDLGFGINWKKGIHEILGKLVWDLAQGGSMCCHVRLPLKD